MIDVENPQNPQIIATVGIPESANNAIVSGNNIFCADGQGLAIYNAGLRTLSGTPSLADRGLLLLNVTATDDLGNSLVEPMAIHVGNINVFPSQINRSMWEVLHCSLFRQEHLIILEQLLSIRQT